MATISPLYAWPMLTAVCMGMECIITGFTVGTVRRKYDIKYPDMGNGRYAAKLTEAQWAEFNNYQRAHYNYVEVCIYMTGIRTLIL